MTTPTSTPTTPSTPPVLSSKPGSNLCCSLVPLKTATKSIAVFQVVRENKSNKVFSIIAVVAFMVAAVPNILGQHGLIPLDKKDKGQPPPPAPDTTNSIGDTWSRGMQPPPPPPPPPTTSSKAQDDSGTFPMWVNLLIVLSVVILSMICLMASINLFKGARDKVEGKCRMWMVINIGLFLLVGVVFGVLCFHGVGIWILGLILVAEVLHGYFIFVVHAFTQQI